MTIGGVSCGPVTIPSSPSSGWALLANEVVPLRCWWAQLEINANDIDSELFIYRAYVVLHEMFGVNAWVLGVSDHLAAQVYPALSFPLFARRPTSMWLASVSRGIPLFLQPRSLGLSTPLIFAAHP